MEDVRLVGAFGDDIVVTRNYASGRPDVAKVSGGRLGLGTRWTFNLNAHLVLANEDTGGVLLFAREDGQGYRFNADLSDGTGRGWTLTQTAVSDCAGTTIPLGWKVTTTDERRYEFDAQGRLVARTQGPGLPVRFCYDSYDRLERVENASGQKLWLVYGPLDELSELRLGSATGPVLVTYAGLMSEVCYGADCAAERWTYAYEGLIYKEGIPEPVAALLTEAWHGDALQERHVYCPQAGDCEGAKVRRSETPSQQLVFTYDDSTCDGGTGIEDLNAASADPWRHSCKTWDINGSLLTSSSPTGCSRDTRAYDWGPGFRASAEALPIGGGALAWNTRTYGSNGVLSAEVENDAVHETTPPAGVTRSTSYTYSDQRHPTYPTRIERTGVLGVPAATDYVYDDAGNVTEVHQEGATRTPTGTVVPFHYVTYTEYLDLGGGRLRPWRVAGPMSYTGGSERPWHTVYAYYDDTGDGVARRAYRLKQITRYPQCPTGSVCAPSYVERTILDYDDFGRPASVQSATGEVTDTTYDQFGRVTSVTRSGETTTTAYDTAGRIQLVTLPAGNAIHYYYESFNGGFSRLKAVTRVAVAPATATNDLPGGTERTVYSYDPQGNVTSEASYADPCASSVTSGTLERLTVREYRQGRVVRVATAAGETAVEMTYDPDNGALLTRTERPNAGQSRTATYTYEWGRLASVDGILYGYNVNGDLTSVNDETGRVSTYSYDDLGRLVASTTPSGSTTRFWYDPRGNVLGRSDAGGRQIAYEYDALGRVLTELRSSGAAVTYGYDASGQSGRLTSVTDTAGTSGFVYDERGRVTSETRQNGARAAHTLVYGYDSNGNLASLTYPNGTVLAYSRVAEDPVGTPRDSDRVRAVSTTTHDLASGVGWHAGGGLAGLTYVNGSGGGATLTRTQTLDGAPYGITVSDPLHSGASLLQLDYAVDRLGRAVAVMRQGPGQPDSSESYTYDGYGRLTNASVSPPLDQGRYDEVSYRYTGPGGVAPTLGNRTQEQRKLGGNVQRSVAYGVGAGSTLVSESGALVGQVGTDDRLLLTRTDDGAVSSAMCTEYDVAGNQRYSGFGTTAADTGTACAAPVRAYCSEYDDWGRVALAGQAQADGSCTPLWTYEYDWKGRRVAVRGQGAFAAKRYDFFYDASDRLLTEIVVASDGTETPEHNYYWLAGEPLAQERLDGTGTVLYYHNDHLGTPQRMSTAAGTVKWAARYSPFGELGEGDVNAAVDCQEPLADNPLRFPGQYDDRRKGTGFWYYNYHRYYDPATGRYTQPDPVTRSDSAGMYALGYSGELPYAYGNNNPVLFSDPTGEGGDVTTLPWPIVGPLVAPWAGPLVLAGLITGIAMGPGDTPWPKTCEPPKPAPPRKPCPPCPTPPPPQYHYVPGQHGCAAGHWHYFVYDQNPTTCVCYPRRVFGGCL